MPELDIENFDALRAYLRRTGRISPDESPLITRLDGGVSNRTVLLERTAGEAWVLKQALAQLRVRVQWFSDPRRIEREASGMRALAALAPPGTIPRLLFLDRENHLLAMEAVAQPHENWKTVLLSGRVDPSHVRQFATLLASIHLRSARDVERLEMEFADQTFFESLRIEPYYLYTAGQAPAAAEFLHDLVSRTRATRLSLVHGDYSPKNILIHEGRLILLDHEVIHFGDGAFDVGFALTHLLSKAHYLPALRPAMAGAAKTWWEIYRDEVGPELAGALEARACDHTLGCLLARCRGRSPLEYLTVQERDRQAQAAISLMGQAKHRMMDLIDGFVSRIA